MYSEKTRQQFGMQTLDQTSGTGEAQRHLFARRAAKRPTRTTSRGRNATREFAAEGLTSRSEFKRSGPQPQFPRWPDRMPDYEPHPEVIDGNEQATKFMYDLLRLLLQKKGSTCSSNGGIPPTIKVDGKMTRCPTRHSPPQHTRSLRARS